jgi:hypothetical protein
LNYLTFKIIVGDDAGAPVFQKLKPWWDSAKKLNETYMGPEFYWAFFQLGDFGTVNMTIVKWEVWSTWRLKNPSEFDKGAFVGVTCGLFFFYPENPESFEQMKKSIETFLQKRKSDKNLILCIALYDHNSYNEVTIEDQPFIEEEKGFVDKIGGRILYFPDTIVDEDMRTNLQDMYKFFLQQLNPGLTGELDIDNNFWYLTIPELRAILTAEQKGIKIRSRHAPPEEIPLVEPEAAEEIPEMAPEPPLENVAISPEGEIVPITEDMTPADIINLVRQGYKLPAWVVIPRHCPKCFNQNQKTIREIEDKSVVLMQNPPIYGTKFYCGNCGNSWR